MRVLSILILALSIPTAFAADLYETALAEEAKAFIPCEEFQKERPLCERLQQARELVRDVPLREFDRRDGKQDVRYREFALALFDPTDETLRVIKLGMPIDVSKQPDFQPIVLSPAQESYRVTRLRGQSLNKMVFEVWYGDRPVHVYAGKHLVYTEMKLHPFYGSRVIPRVEEVVYLPAQPRFVNEEFARAGQAHFQKGIENALAELRARRVGSLAFSGRLVSDVVTANEVANLVMAEQTDPCLLEQRPKACEALIPIRPYRDDTEVRRAVSTEFVLNGWGAFRYMRSRANAGGVLQFTNNPIVRIERVPVLKQGRLITIKQKVVRPGTYSAVAELYPEALLDPIFERATRSLANLAKAAACLVDLELANRRLPEWVRESFLGDRSFGLVIPGAAYNGGPSQSRRVAEILEGFIKKQGLDFVSFDFFPWEEFLSSVEHPKSGIKPETRGYIRKIIDNVRHLREHKPPAPAVNFEGVLA